jgi:pyruvate-formate lyase-activating enzyme
MKSPNQINIENMKLRMEEIETKLNSNTACIAKWMQTTINLFNGTTHSCHHTPLNKISVEEIKVNYSALHNTKQKKLDRMDMMDGMQPKSCNYCWNIENSGDHISDRMYKSTDTEWAYLYLDKVAKCGPTKDIDPSYVEISFSNVCQMSCMYCSPEISSKWMEEVERYGPYNNGIGDLTWIKQQDRMPIPHKDHNPYVEAFWNWWPTLQNSINVLRITGGEPLLSNDFWKLLDNILQNPLPHLKLVVNTNMMVPKKLIDKLCDYANKLNGKVKEFEIYTSCEAVSIQAEYIRYGMNYNTFIENVAWYLGCTPDSYRVNFMITFNALSLTTFKDFMEDVLELRKTFNENDGFNRIPFVISYLRWPQFQDVRILDNDFKMKYINDVSEYMHSNDRNNSDSPAGRFYLEELDQIERLKDYMMQPLDTYDLNKRLSDFKSFYNEYDKRRGTDFLKVFPEYKAYYEGI